MAFTVVTITADYDLANGTDPVGSISFTPTKPMVNGTTVVSAPVARRLNIDGLLLIDVAANTDPATTPDDAVYLVEESIGGATRNYYVTIPHDAGAVVDLADLDKIFDAPPVDEVGVSEDVVLPQWTALLAAKADRSELTTLTGYLTVRDPAYGGATGDGSTNDTAAISAAMDAANAAGRALFFPAGDYVCGSITKTYAPRIFAVPGTVTIRAANTSSYTWTFTGALGSTVALTANVALGASVLTMGTTAGFAAGDLVLVGDDQASYATQSTRKRGQLAQVASVDSGTTLTLVESLYAPMLTASSAFLAKVTAPDRARISGLRFLNTNAASTGGFLRCTYLRDVTIDVDGEGSGAAGIQLNHVYDFRVRTTARSYYDNVGSSQFGYGVECAGACAHGQVDVHAVKVRHAFTCGGIDSTTGEPVDIRVTGAAHGTTAQSWDAHAQGSDITFVDCQAYGPKSYGFALRGKRQHIQGGVVQGGYGGAWLFEQPVDNRIAGLRVSDAAASDAADSSGAGGRGIRVGVATSGLTITGCELNNVARDGILIEAASSDVTISNNLIRNVGQVAVSGHRSAIHANAALTRARIAGNVVTDNQGSITTVAGITLDASSIDVSVRDNDVQTGISVLTGTGAASAVVRTTFVDSITPWLPQSATAAASIASTLPGGRVGDLQSGGVLVSGRLTLAGGIVLPANRTISQISFLSAGTAAVTPTNQWFCLVDQSLNVLAKTADATTAAWGADALRSFSISGGYTPVVDIPVYLGIVVVAGTVPTLRQVGITSLATGKVPILAATADTGLTNPASLGATTGALTALPNLAFAYVS